MEETWIISIITKIKDGLKQSYPKMCQICWIIWEFWAFSLAMAKRIKSTWPTFTITTICTWVRIDSKLRLFLIRGLNLRSFKVILAPIVALIWSEKGRFMTFRSTREVLSRRRALKKENIIMCRPRRKDLMPQTHFVWKMMHRRASKIKTSSLWQSNLGILIGLAPFKVWQQMPQIRDQI